MHSCVYVLSFLFISLWSVFGALAASIIVDDRDPSVTLTGTWARGAGAAQEYLQTTSSSTVAGSTMKFKFNGADVAIFATINPGTATSFSFAIDGGTPQVFTATATTVTQFHSNIFIANTLSEGAHTLVITQTNAGTNVGIDYFLVVPGASSDLINETLFADDQDSAIQYTGSWSDSVGTDQDLQGTLHGAATKGSTASLVFDGTAIIVYGSIPQGSSGAVASFSIDGQTISTYTIASDLVFANSVAANQVLFSQNRLTAGQHTLVMTAEAANVLFFDYTTITGFVDLSTLSSTAATQSTSQPSSTSQSAKSTASQSSSVASSDTLSFGALPTTSGSGTTSSSSASVTGTNSSDAASTSTSRHTSNGAVVGGAIAGVAVLLGGIIFLCLRQRRRRNNSMVRSKIESQFDRNGDGGFMPSSNLTYSAYATEGAAETANSPFPFLAAHRDQQQAQTPLSPYFVQDPRPASRVWTMPSSSVVGERNEVTPFSSYAPAPQQSRFSNGLALVSPHSPPRSPATSPPPLPQTPYRDMSPAPRIATPVVSLPVSSSSAHPLDNGTAAPEGALSRAQTLGAQSIASASGRNTMSNGIWLSAQSNDEGYYDLGILSPDLRTPGPADRPTTLARGPSTVKSLDWRTTMQTEAANRTSFAPSMMSEASLPYADSSAPPVPALPASVASSSHVGVPLPVPGLTTMPTPSGSSRSGMTEKQQLAAAWAARDRLQVREADAASRLSSVSAMSSTQNIGMRMLSGDDADLAHPHDDFRPPPSYSPAPTPF